MENVNVGLEAPQWGLRHRCGGRRHQHGAEGIGVKPEVTPWGQGHQRQIEGMTVSLGTLTEEQGAGLLCSCPITPACNPNPSHPTTPQNLSEKGQSLEKRLYCAVGGREEQRGQRRSRAPQPRHRAGGA